MPEIILKNITKRFGKSDAVENLNLEIRDGDFITLLGPSGCGKTTTLRMIAGLETPTEGEIYIDGKLVFSAEKGLDVPPDKRDVGFLFQNYALWPHMTVSKNISFGLENLKWEKSRITERVRELLTMLRIEDYAARYPSELSGGQQQRVAIARTLATNPRVLLMDEPLSNLDAKLRMEMRTELKRLHVETHSTFVYVTHDQLEAMTLSTKVCLLKKGFLQQYSPPLEIYGQPANTFVADFVGSPSINLVDCVARDCGSGHVRLHNEDMDLIFTPTRGELAIADGAKLILGLRPETISIFGANEAAMRDIPASGELLQSLRPDTITIAESGCLKGRVYSSLPSGMETIVRLHVGATAFTSVVFGSIDFQINEQVSIGLDSDRYMLFDGESGEWLAMGRLKIAGS